MIGKAVDIVKISAPLTCGPRLGNRNKPRERRADDKTGNCI